MPSDDLTDEDLIAIAKANDASLLRQLTPDERTRLIALAQQEEPAAQPDQPGTNAALGLSAASAAIPAVSRLASKALASPNAPRVIQRAIGAGVRSAGGIVGAGVGGVPGAIIGATATHGLTPTQQTIRGWLPGRQAAETAGDGVVNYVKSMAADTANMGPAAKEYTTQMGRQYLYDEFGKARLVPSSAEASVAKPAAEGASRLGRLAGGLSQGLSLASGAQGALDLAQMAEPGRRDIGFLGMGAAIPDLEILQAAVKKGANPVAAAAAITKGNRERFSALMTAFAQASGQGSDAQTAP